MSPAYPPAAVAPPPWKPLEWPPRDADLLGHRMHTKSPLARYRTWAGIARSHIRQYGMPYCDGYAAAWNLHGATR